MPSKSLGLGNQPCTSRVSGSRSVHKRLYRHAEGDCGHAPGSSQQNRGLYQTVGACGRACVVAKCCDFQPFLRPDAHRSGQRWHGLRRAGGPAHNVTSAASHISVSDGNDSYVSLRSKYSSGWSRSRLQTSGSLGASTTQSVLPLRKPYFHRCRRVV